MKWEEDYLKEKLLMESDDVFFLYETELLMFYNINHSSIKSNERVDPKLRDKISERKKEFYRYKSSLPPKFLKNGIEFDDTVMEYDKNAVYGAAASPGIFKGIG